MNTTVSRRLVASTLAGGVIGAGAFLAAPMAQAADTADDCPYPTVCDPGSGGGVVLGEEANAPGSAGNNRAGAVLGRQASSGSTRSGTSTGLGATGADVSTELLGLLGVGLVGAGTISVVVNRRRQRADAVS